MGKYTKGDVVWMPFPFSDLSANKDRPCLVIASFKGDDMLLCQITATTKDIYSITLTDTDFVKGALNKLSYIRPNRIFTGDEKIVRSYAGTVSKAKMKEVVDKIIELIQ